MIDQKRMRVVKAVIVAAVLLLAAACGFLSAWVLGV